MSVSERVNMREKKIRGFSNYCMLLFMDIDIELAIAIACETAIEIVWEQMSRRRYKGC